jgi:hypothetical protein
LAADESRAAVASESLTGSRAMPASMRILMVEDDAPDVNLTDHSPPTFTASDAL